VIDASSIMPRLTIDEVTPAVTRKEGVRAVAASHGIAVRPAKESIRA
jgi:hypothetical protein